MPKKEKPEVAELRDQLDKVIERSREILHRGKEELVRLGQVGKLHLDLLNYQRQQRHTFEELGKSLHQAYRNEYIGQGLLDRRMIQLLEKIDALDKRARECRDKIATLEEGSSSAQGVPRPPRRTS